MNKSRFGTISGRGAWATIFAVLFLGFAFAFAAAIPLAIALKALLYETNRKLRAMVLLNVFLSGWLAVCATTYVELRASPRLPEIVNSHVIDFYSSIKFFGPAVTTLVWMNVFLLPSTTMYTVLGIKGNKKKV